MTDIIHKNTAVAHKRPDTLAAGELAINLNAASPALWIKDTNNNPRQIAGIKIVTTLPTGVYDANNTATYFNYRSEGDLAYLITDQKLYIFYDGAWVSVTGSGGSGGEANTASNLGSTGVGVFKEKTGVDLRFRRLVAGTGVTLTENADNIQIDATGGGGGEANTASNLGASGGRVFSDKSGVDLRFRRIVAGTNITVTENVNDLTIAATNNGTVTSVGLSGANGISVTGSPITGSGTITVGLGNITPNSVAAIGNVTGANLSGTNTGDQTITLSGDVSGSGTGSITATLANSGVTAATYGSSTQIPVIAIDAKGRVTSAANQSITLGEINTASNLGSTGGRVFSDKSGADLRFRRIVAGTNITVTENADNLTIAATASSGEANTASNLGSSGGRVFSDKSGVDLRFRRIVAGTNITVTENADNLTIAATGGGSGEANTASNLGASGVSVFKQKTGVDLEFRKLIGGSGISLTENANDIQIVANLSSVEPVINGVQHFYRNTKPTERVGGGALVEGDIWRKLADSGLNGSAGEWSWNGTYWVSPLDKVEFFNSSGVTTTTNSGEVAIPWSGYQLLLRQFAVLFNAQGATNNSTDYWTFELQGRAGNLFSSVGATVLSTQGDTWANNTNQILRSSENILLSEPTKGGTVNIRAFRIAYTRVGTPSNMNAVSYVVHYQRVHP